MDETNLIFYFVKHYLMRTLTPAEFTELTQNDYYFLLFCCWTDCTKCKMQEPVLESLEWEIQMPLYKIDCQEEQRAASRFDVTVLPTIIKMRWSEEEQRIEWEVQPKDYILDFFRLWNVKLQESGE